MSVCRHLNSPRACISVIFKPSDACPCHPWQLQQPIDFSPKLADAYSARLTL